MSSITSTQHAMQHSHHSLQCDCHDATTSVLDGMPATCKLSSGIAVWCDAISMDGNGERQARCWGDSKAEKRYHALVLPARLSRLQQTTVLLTNQQLQVQLHICIPSHLSNIGVNCRTRICLAKGIHRECSCVTELFQTWRKMAKAEQRRAQMFAYLLMLWRRICPSVSAWQT